MNRLSNGAPGSLPLARALVFLGLALAASACSSAKPGPAAPTPPDGARARELNERALKLLDGRKYAEAEKTLNEAIAADRMYGPARNNLGLAYYHTGRLYDAAWAFDEAIRLMPHQPEPRNNLGMVLEQAGRLGDAASAYARARQIEPDNPLYIGNLARARVRNGDADPETRGLLEELLLKDTRPAWQEWARMTLHRLPREAPATQPVDR